MTNRSTLLSLSSSPSPEDRSAAVAGTPAIHRAGGLSPDLEPPASRCTGGGVGAKFSPCEAPLAPQAVEARTSARSCGDVAAGRDRHLLSQGNQDGHSPELPRVQLADGPQPARAGRDGGAGEVRAADDGPRDLHGAGVGGSELRAPDRDDAEAKRQAEGGWRRDLPGDGADGADGLVRRAPALAPRLTQDEAAGSARELIAGAGALAPGGAYRQADPARLLSERDRRVLSAIAINNIRISKALLRGVIVAAAIASCSAAAAAVWPSAPVQLTADQ